MFEADCDFARTMRDVRALRLKAELLSDDGDALIGDTRVIRLTGAALNSLVAELLSTTQVCLFAAAMSRLLDDTPARMLDDIAGAVAEQHLRLTSPEPKPAKAKKGN